MPIRVRRLPKLLGAKINNKTLAFESETNMDVPCLICIQINHDTHFTNSQLNTIGIAFMFGTSDCRSCHLRIKINAHNMNGMRSETIMDVCMYVV